jgi:hypothetical protein
MAQTKTAAPAAKLDAELARRLLTQMWQIRRFEEKAAEMYALGKIGGFLHLYVGRRPSPSARWPCSAPTTTRSPHIASTGTASPRAATHAG